MLAGGHEAGPNEVPDLDAAGPELDAGVAAHDQLEDRALTGLGAEHLVEDEAADGVDDRAALEALDVPDDVGVVGYDDREAMAASVSRGVLKNLIVPYMVSRQDGGETNALVPPPSSPPSPSRGSTEEPPIRVSWTGPPGPRPGW